PTENEPDHPDRRDLPQPPRRRSRLCRGRAWRDEPCQGLASCTLSRAEHTLAFVRCEPDHVTSSTSASIPNYDASRCGAGCASDCPGRDVQPRPGQALLELSYANGDREVLYFKDFASGAMIESIARRAKKLALKR